MEVLPTFSPDGDWVAYRSNESGRYEIWVRPYPGPGPSHLVSTDGGETPLWSRDGTEIFYRNGQSLMSAAVRTKPDFSSDPPRVLFAIPDDIELFAYGFYDATPDGQRFVMVQKDPVELRPPELVIIPNWITELEARMANAELDSR
jgi:serine/threonine-protein kinase